MKNLHYLLIYFVAAFHTFHIICFGFFQWKIEYLSIIAHDYQHPTFQMSFMNIHVNKTDFNYTHSPSTWTWMQKFFSSFTFRLWTSREREKTKWCLGNILWPISQVREKRREKDRRNKSNKTSEKIAWWKNLSTCEKWKVFLNKFFSLSSHPFIHFNAFSFFLLIYTEYN